MVAVDRGDEVLMSLLSSIDQKGRFNNTKRLVSTVDRPRIPLATDILWPAIETRGAPWLFFEFLENAARVSYNVTAASNGVVL